MSLTFKHEQLFDDCDIPVTIRWEIEYVPDDEEGFLIVSKSVLSVTTWFGDVGFVAMLETKDIKGIEHVERWAKANAKLDDDALWEACLFDWERIGKDLWHEMKGAA